MIYFTSDLHFYHDNVIRYAHRPFADAEEMSRKLVKNWNETVTAKDEVYILGDLTMKGAGLATEMIYQLKGIKYMVRGNHDRFLSSRDFDPSLFGWIKDYAEMTYQSTKVVLCHYPILEWNGFFRGSIHLHGHQHNPPDYNFQNRQKGIRRYDVGVDANYMKPVSVEAVLQFFQQDA